MNGNGGYVKRSKPDTERQIPYVFSFMKAKCKEKNGHK
jgi:hypothetical protein